MSRRTKGAVSKAAEQKGPVYFVPTGQKGGVR